MIEITEEMVETALSQMIDVVDSYVWEEDRDQAREAMFLALAAIALQIAAQENEACAKVCDARVMGDCNREDQEAKRCAAAIRERGRELR